MMTFNKKLKAILLKRGILEPEKLEKASAKADENKSSLATILLTEKLLEDKILLATLSAEMNIPPINLERLQPEPEALEVLEQEAAKGYRALPLSKVGNLLTIAVVNPFDVVRLDDLQLITGCSIRPVIATEPALLAAIDRAYNADEHEMATLIEGIKEQDIETIATGKEEEGAADLSAAVISGNIDSPIIKLVNMIVFQGIKNRVSDIHIEPFEKKIRVRYRSDGALYEAYTPPKKMLGAMISRLKILANLDIAERRRPQDGKFQVKAEGRQIDFRLSILPTIHGEKAVLRILDSSNLALSLDSLGFEPQAMEAFHAAVSAPYGMLLVTGPTGSGKSTTLYSTLKEVLCIEENIITVEDPVEYQLDGVIQVPVNPKAGLTFADALRSILRQDPDTIMIGEIRDRETVDIAIKAALTGHLVLSTLHTNDAPSTITRLIDMGVDPFMVASSVLLVAAQRLGRRLCKECRREMTTPLPRERLLAVGFRPEDLTDKLKILEAPGCPNCKHGYRGRFALLEVLAMQDEIKRMIIGGGSALDIKKVAMEKYQMITLRRCGILNIIKGVTSIEEVLSSTMGD